jgi:ABC-type dipeptide/oligopeptide/nickel transport system ATPase component
MPSLLEVSNLSVDFHTDDGVFRAVDGAGFTLERGVSLGIVGEVRVREERAPRFRS